MKFTRHAEARLKQRGWNKQMVDIVMSCGRAEHAPGGVTRIFLGKKEVQDIFQEIKGLLQIVNRAKGGTLILKDNNIITAYKGG
jgi:hypothetical protein